MSTAASPSAAEAIFAPVRSQTAFEETVERLGTAVRLGLLPPGTRLPAERELCTRMGIARSTLRQALVALGQSGHLHAVRGRGGGTFVADPQPPPTAPTPELIAAWRSVCDERVAVEVGIAVVAAQRADSAALDELDEIAAQLDDLVESFSAYRKLDIRLHVGLAESTGLPRLVSASTETQSAMSSLIALIPHPPEVLASSNEQHRGVLSAVRRRDVSLAARAMHEHLLGTEHILAGLLPAS